jgi:hypothetical protein
LKINKTDRFRALLNEGRSRDAALGELRREGASPFDCIRAIIETEGVGVAQAKRLFTETSSWARYVHESDEALVRELEIFGTEEAGARVSRPMTSIETKARKREVQLIIDVAEPDPEYQAFILTDEASLLDAVATEPGEISRRLNTYFGADLGLDLGTPVWRLVDRIKQLRPGWPDEPDRS